MESFEATAEVYSPRWGHTDTYRFHFSEDKLIISHGPRERIATWDSDGGPNWHGRNSLSDMMRNDSIHPPERAESLIGYIWEAWRDGRLDNTQAQEELTAFIDYINASTAAKPKTEFWRGIF